ncbi:MAG: tetratricopeptide repeat protein [Alphaproteobacteria bacterium]|nr:tetratricopeptide repeat protein [Alphaproteobacteria bacterium]
MAGTGLPEGRRGARMGLVRVMAAFWHWLLTGAAAAVAVCLGPVAAAQSPELIAIQERYQALYAAGAYADAAPLAEKPVRRAKSEFGGADPRLSTELNNLAEIYRTQGRYAEAEPLYR